MKKLMASLMTAAAGVTNVQADDTSSLSVNTTTNIRPDVNASANNHVASGGLYALTDSNTPNASLLSPLKLTTFTQSPPDGKQVGNGAGEFNSVGPLVHQLGAKQIVRLADI